MVIPLNCKIFFHYYFLLSLKEYNFANLKFMVLISIKDILKCRNKIYHFFSKLLYFFL